MPQSVNRVRKEALEVLTMWAESEEYHDPKTGDIRRYAICAGLAVCEHAKTAFPIKKSQYLTNKNQVKTSGALIQKILSEFGIEKSFASEGGRTTRGTVPAAKALVNGLNAILDISLLSNEQRVQLFLELQGRLVERVKDFFNRQRLEVEFDFSDSATSFISRIMSSAKGRNQGGPVMQHLVGAKLALRFPKLIIENHNYTTADKQLGRKGDFEIKDTVFHVTVAPAEKLMQKMRNNLSENYRVVLITSRDKLNASSEMADQANIIDKIDIYAVESFVAQNIDELASFNRTSFFDMFFELLKKYNERVDATETDKSLLISIPGQLEQG